MMSSLIFRKCVHFPKQFYYRKYHCKKLLNDNKYIDVPLNRQPLRFSFGLLAKFADGSCTANLGDTSVLVTAVSKAKNSVASFVPLLVDYRQKASAAGRIPTNHLRREIGVTEQEILTSRVIDRSIRPLFPKGFGFETQLSCNLLAVDGIYDPDVVSINAASAALALSDIPWNGPIGAVRVGLVDGKIIINPTRKELSQSCLNLVVAATGHNQVVMLEASANNILQQDFIEALKEEPSAEIMDSTKLLLKVKIEEILTNYSLNKISRGIEIDVVKQETVEKLKENYPDCDTALLYESANIVVKDIFRNLIMETRKRCDGRDLQDLRDISCDVNLYKPLHGSAVFQRGQTQVFCTVSFDSLDAAYKADSISVLTGGIEEKKFMVHYEFPPYATNDIGRSGSFGRRELGHGALVEKSLRPVVPSDFPLTVKLTSEVFESNGSSSMASVCGGSMALMDAGVSICAPVAGIAMGLISVPNLKRPYEIEDYRILTDILGLEDYLGDMDFKIAGSEKSISALQLDVKVPGVPLQVIKDAIEQGIEGKDKILNIMNEVIYNPENRKIIGQYQKNLKFLYTNFHVFLELGDLTLKK
ncbi:polyribonucleotide nucleotidyltransferase 1, mitochondrial [Caerostris darwini]|uniref:polyribonucleotide nucleotidyltransferase n=1 Tax=Caerostris darwini TaxID=1538125 RepID=A0AAV4T9D8_9ARAC|nr:polyribonucleotide nucleotidyltransferase 1, mitochondrial [Caerostris darwini]